MILEVVEGFPVQAFTPVGRMMDYNLIYLGSGLVVGVFLTLVAEIVLVVFFRKWIAMKIMAYYTKKAMEMFKV